MLVLDSVFVPQYHPSRSRIADVVKLDNNIFTLFETLCTYSSMFVSLYIDSYTVPRTHSESGLNVASVGNDPPAR